MRDIHVCQISLLNFLFKVGITEYKIPSNNNIQNLGKLTIYKEQPPPRTGIKSTPKILALASQSQLYQGTLRPLPKGHAALGGLLIGEAIETQMLDNALTQKRVKRKYPQLNLPWREKG